MPGVLGALGRIPNYNPKTREVQFSGSSVLVVNNAYFLDNTERGVNKQTTALGVFQAYFRILHNEGLDKH